MDRSPFKFLDAYQKEDIKQFFGRDEESKELFNKTFESNLLLVYGLSGTGKTSLLQCGMANLFADTDWLPLMVRRKDHIIESLKESIYNAAVEKEALEGKSIPQQLRSLYLDYYKPTYLLFDQFEELFIMGDKEAEVDAFFELLAELLDTRLQVKIILIMREEYLANLDRYEKLIPTLFDNRFRVERMRTEDIQGVIQKSADYFEIEIEPPADELTARMVEQLKDDRGRIDLANMQIYLDRLYKDAWKRGDGDSIRFDRKLVERAGKISKVLSRFLDEQLGVLDQDFGQKGVSLSILAQLITGEGTKQPRDMQSITEQVGQNKKIEPKLVADCISKMVNMRILRILENE